MLVLAYNVRTYSYPNYVLKCINVSAADNLTDDIVTKLYHCRNRETSFTIFMNV